MDEQPAGLERQRMSSGHDVALGFLFGLSVRTSPLPQVDQLQ